MRLLLTLWDKFPGAIKNLIRQLVPSEIRSKLSSRIVGTIDPIDLPDIEFVTGMDMILIDLPQRYMPMMPNGLGYVYNALKSANIRCQVVDCNIIFYHRYHSKKIQNDNSVAADLWDNTSTGEWDKPETLEHFKPWVTEIITKLAEAQPKIIGFSSSGSNRLVVREIINGIRKLCPNTVIVIGGYDCMRHWLAPRLVSDYDYIVIGEAELIIGPLIKALLEGERPKDLPGVLSRYDTLNRSWQNAPMPKDLNSIDFPHYEWTDISLYRDFKGNHLIPIVTTRGCVWGRCRFCSEGFIKWRERSPSLVVDEIQWFVKQGFRNFHINDSDMNNNPSTLSRICDQIIQRKLKIRFSGQARVRKDNGPELFKRLHQAGCVHLRWGIDGWTDRTLRLQNKGYTMMMAEASLRRCHEAGIRTTANLVIGIPGETEDDITESVKNVIKFKSYIDCMENINILILTAGSRYYNNPEKYGIHFYGKKEEIYEKYPYYIPHDQWYCHPDITYQTRLQRLHYIHDTLASNGVEIGGFAKNRAEEIEKGKAGQPEDWALKN
jgi:radical SAM superfamily enzyme YgiQ (UPF0313 family)